MRFPSMTMVISVRAGPSPSSSRALVNTCLRISISCVFACRSERPSALAELLRTPPLIPLFTQQMIEQTFLHVLGQALGLLRARHLTRVAEALSHSRVEVIAARDYSDQGCPAFRLTLAQRNNPFPWTA